MKIILLILSGISFGLLAAAGVFTVLIAVGLIPRFAGRTHTARSVLLYENMVVLGTILGAFASLFPEWSDLFPRLMIRFPQSVSVLSRIGSLVQTLFGFFGGIFVGCLALAIAEMLDSIPIFTRRISFRRGIGLAVLGIALGKFCGSLLYFLAELHRTA